MSILPEFEYPFDSNQLLLKKKSLKKALLENDSDYIQKKLAILGGSTTSEIKNMLELFLLNYGIKPLFYESEYNKYYEDAIFDNPQLEAFNPDIIYLHTSNRNIKTYPTILNSKAESEALLNDEYTKFTNIWQSLRKKYNCVIIQNNFELPSFRLLGNKDASSESGRVNFITRLNLKFYEYAEANANFFINDINYLSASFGLDAWNDSAAWYMYKYALAVPAIPLLAFNIANIIKSIYGKNKKGLVLDLDNTLWGGIVGDDGAENLVIGKETALGEAFYEFQDYLKSYQDLGIILNVNSKNERENALAGLNHPSGLLKPDDFIVIKANWESKDVNMLAIAAELKLGPDALVFVDDNPAEREIVKKQLPKVAVPVLKNPEEYIRALDKSGFFEVTNTSEDDTKRNAMYQENIWRSNLEATFSNYEEYLISLKMKATIKPFAKIYYARIAQLSNKSNQFNLTTKRYSEADIENIAEDHQYIKLYGSLTDVFGDNGIISVVIGKIDNKILHIDLWIMSCRVLKRNMEYAMMDALVGYAKANKIEVIRGYYYPTAKNKMVKDFYELQGFTKKEEDQAGNAIWSLDLANKYLSKNHIIEVESSDE